MLAKLDEQKHILDEQKQDVAFIRSGVQQQLRQQTLRQEAAFFAGGGTHRSNDSQQAFKRQLVERYQNGVKGKMREGRQHWVTLRCIVTGSVVKYEDCIAGHLLPHSAMQSMAEFGLDPTDINDVRNGLLWAKGIEQVFHPPGRVCILHDFLHNQLRFFVLDPQLLEQRVDGTDRTFRDVDGAVLRVTPAQWPYLRFLWKHAVASVKAATKSNFVNMTDDKWRVPIETMEMHLVKMTQTGCNSSEAMRGTKAEAEGGKRKQPDSGEGASGEGVGVGAGAHRTVSLVKTRRK